MLAQGELRAVEDTDRKQKKKKKTQRTCTGEEQRRRVAHCATHDHARCVRRAAGTLVAVGATATDNKGVHCGADGERSEEKKKKKKKKKKNALIPAHSLDVELESQELVIMWQHTSAA